MNSSWIVPALYLDGWLDGWGWWNRQLSPVEVQALYNGGAGFDPL